MKKLFCCVSFCIMLFSTAIIHAGFAEELPPMQLHQVNVGCANCHLLIAGETVILIDGGTNRYKPSLAPAGKPETGNSPDEMLRYVAASGIDHIDAHFVTHYHNDHAQQIPEFSLAYGTDHTVLYGPSEKLPDRYLPLPHGTYQQLRNGEEIHLGPFHILCVGPRVVQREGEINEDSLNLLITYGKIRMLFTGDYMYDEVCESYGSLVKNVDIFIFPHHGLTPYAVTSGALQILHPGIILLPGDAEGMLRSFCLSHRWHFPIYGNRHGNIMIESDGAEIQVHEQVQPGEFAVNFSRNASHTNK